MTRSTVVANHLSYTVSGLGTPARGDIFQALVSARLVDGETLAPIEGPIRVSTSSPGLRPCVASGGFVGLVGTPSRALPGLNATPYDVDLVVETAGYLTRRDVRTFAPQPGFPGVFSAADLGDLSLRRSALVIGVRTSVLNGALQPVPQAGATVRIDGTWRTTAALSGAAAGTHLLAVGPALQSGRPVGTAISVPALGVPAEPPRELSAAASGGENLVQVTHRGGFVVGDLVGLDLADPERAERIEVVAVHGPTTVTSPCVLELRFPLSYDHAEGASAIRVTVPALGAAVATVTEAAVAGDRTLVLNALAGLAPGDVVRIHGGAAADEYCTADVYSVTTNADGFARFSPITGFAAVHVTATSGALSGAARLSLTGPAPAVALTLT